MLATLRTRSRLPELVPCPAQPRIWAEPASAGVRVAWRPVRSAAPAAGRRMRRRYCRGAIPAVSSNSRVRWRGEVRATCAMASAQAA